MSNKENSKKTCHLCCSRPCYICNSFLYNYSLQSHCTSLKSKQFLIFHWFSGKDIREYCINIYIFVCRFTTYQLSADIFHFNEFLEKEYRDLSFMADFKINILFKFYTVNFNNVRIPKVWDQWDFLMFWKKSLMFIKAALIWSKLQ